MVLYQIKVLQHENFKLDAVSKEHDHFTVDLHASNRPRHPLG